MEINDKYGKAMGQYRFELDRSRPRKKLRCPNCGKMRYTRYVDILDRVELPYEVGICDRINSCGYKYTVRQYLNDNPRGLEGHATCDVRRPREPVDRELSYHSRELMERTCNPLHYHRNPLYRYLTSLWTPEEVDEVMDMYRVGTSARWDGAAVFWQIDTSGKVRGGKIMGYDPATGRRIKSPRSQVSWVHSAMGMTDFNMGQCLFGSHLARGHADDGRRIWIVESEKTALIGSLYFDDALFMATGGMHGISESMDMEALRGREVVLMPDVGCRDEWRRMAVYIAKIADKVYMSPFLSDKEDDPAWLGKDIADYIVEQLALE